MLGLRRFTMAEFIVKTDHPKEKPLLLRLASWADDPRPSLCESARTNSQINYCSLSKFIPDGWSVSRTNSANVFVSVHIYTVCLWAHLSSRTCTTRQLIYGYCTCNLVKNWSSQIGKCLPNRSFDFLPNEQFYTTARKMELLMVTGHWIVSS